jgi:Fic family protein
VAGCSGINGRIKSEWVAGYFRNHWPDHPGIRKIGIHGADSVLAAVVSKGQFWERAAPVALNERQITVLNRLLDGFEGKMTSSKWAVIAKCSQDTANRDITALLDLGLLRRGDGGGRSTHYELVL